MIAIIKNSRESSCKKIDHTVPYVLFLLKSLVASELHGAGKV